MSPVSQLATSSHWHAARRLVARETHGIVELGPGSIACLAVVLFLVVAVTLGWVFWGRKKWARRAAARRRAQDVEALAARPPTPAPPMRERSRLIRFASVASARSDSSDASDTPLTGGVSPPPEAAVIRGVRTPPPPYRQNSGASHVAPSVSTEETLVP